MPQPCGKGSQSVFLYDVTSVYFDGVHNELADFGYNRDGKKGKKQMVAGLLTDAEGEPLSIQLYRGNTNDPPTFLDAVNKLKVRFGAEEVALVGDRGMIKALGNVMPRHLLDRRLNPIGEIAEEIAAEPSLIPVMLQRP